MSTLVFVDPESSTQADRTQSSRVPAYLVETDTEFETFRTPESPHIVAPLTCHVEESEGSGTSGARSTSSDSTAPLSPDHPLTHTTPALVLILCRTARMAVRVPPAMSPGLSAGIAEVAAMFDLALCKRFRSSYDSSPSPTLPVRKRYKGTSELILVTDSEEDEEVEDCLDSDSESEGTKEEGSTAEDEDPVAGDEGLSSRVEGPGVDDESYGLDDESYGLDDKRGGGCTWGSAALRHQELALEGDHVYSTFEVGQGSGSRPEPKRSKRVSASRQPTLTTWTDPEDGMVYIDVPIYPPPALPVQTPPSPEWTSSSLPISPSPSIVPLPVSSPMIPLTVPSSIASPMATLTTTILVDEDQFIEILIGMSLEHEQERTAVTFRALSRPMLALEAWAWHHFAVRATGDERSCYCVGAGKGPYRAVEDMRFVRVFEYH
nr:hypothetical protein [Tanacetum cinerariifolium]